MRRLRIERPGPVRALSHARRLYPLIVSMNFDPRLYVEIVPLDNGRSPQPHPVNDGRFDPDYAYKVLGIYNPSETSECYLMLANPDREIWFIPQRHTRAYGLLDGDALFVRKEVPSDEFRRQNERRNGVAPGSL
jgi:hypothetical protein